MMTDLRTELAPCVAEDWVDAFVLEARLRDLPGARIGEALSEVNAHVADSGESAHAAFGDPTAYAALLAREAAPAPASPSGSLLATLTPALVQVLGVVLTLHGVGGWVTGRGVPVTWGLLGMLVVLCLGMVVVAFAVRSSLRTLVRRPLVAVLVGGVAALVLSSLLWLTLAFDAPITTLPGVAFVVPGLCAVLVGIGLEVRGIASGRLVDPISSPVPEPGATGSDRRRARWESRVPLTSLTALVWLVLGTLALVLLA